jgi:hypothetical protein
VPKSTEGLYGPGPNLRRDMDRGADSNDEKDGDGRKDHRSDAPLTFPR